VSQELFYSIYQAAILSNYTPLTIRTAIKTGKLPAALIENKYHIWHSDFEIWLASKGRTAKAGA